ncbi:MAG: universal stress protein [Chloroflexi bacterium]|jgi:nucleotide-binding universal stress UspA family protein|nr:universal stress protein [Chloroflexota bacterium]MDA1282436.1 universal stress protein [Chloroflexota bacterium]
MIQHTDSTSRTQNEIRRLAVGRGVALNLDRILVPLNGYRRSEQILPFSSMLAEWFEGETTLFHTLPPTHPARGARPGQVQYPDAPHDRGASLASAYLEEVVSRLGPHGVKSRWGIATGDPAPMISSRSATSSFGMVAIAATARSRPHRFFSPGLLDHLWRTTSVPLLIVNPLHATLNGEPPQPPKTIIVPCTRSAVDSALPFVSAIAGASRSTVRVVLTKSASSGEMEDELINKFTNDEVHVEIQHVADNLVQQVLGLQSENTGSWIVSGSRMRSGLTRSMFGSFADSIARDATGPVVVVPDAKVMRQRERAAHELTRDLPSSL